MCPQKLNRPDVILFDIDDTFYSTGAPHRAALEQSIELFTKITGIPTERSKKMYGEARNYVKLFLSRTAASHSRLLYFQRMLESCRGIRTNLDICSAAVELEELYWSTYLIEMQVEPELESLISTIVDSKVRIGIVTDLTAQIQMRKLMRLGISSYVSLIVSSEESGLDKPNFTCFSLANEKANPNNYELDYWMVGDHLHKDILGAKTELQARTFWICSMDLRPDTLPGFVDHVLENVIQLKSFAVPWLISLE